MPKNGLEKNYLVVVRMSNMKEDLNTIFFVLCRSNVIKIPVGMKLSKMEPRTRQRTICNDSLLHGTENRKPAIKSWHDKCGNENLPVSFLFPCGETNAALIQSPKKQENNSAPVHRSTETHQAGSGIMGWCQEKRGKI